MSEYKIESILPDPPKQWKGPHGVVWYRTAMVEGHDKPLSVGKKSPDALKVGDTIYGDIIPTDFLEDKFKPSAPPANQQASMNKTDGSQYLKDLSDMPLRVFTASLPYVDAQGLLSQSDYRRKFLEYVMDVSNELLTMSENIRKDENAGSQSGDWGKEQTPSSAIKEPKTQAASGPSPIDGEPFEGDPSEIPFD